MEESYQIMETPREGAVYVYTIFDRKMKEFGPLNTAKNDGTVCRDVLAGLRNSESMLAQYPEDFDLFRVGMFDPATGEIARVPPQLVINLHDLTVRDRKDVHNAAGS